MSDDSLDLALYGAFDGRNQRRLAEESGRAMGAVWRLLLRLSREHRALLDSRAAGAALSESQRARLDRLEAASPLSAVPQGNEFLTWLRQSPPIAQRSLIGGCASQAQPPASIAQKFLGRTAP